MLYWTYCMRTQKHYKGVMGVMVSEIPANPTVLFGSLFRPASTKTSNVRITVPLCPWPVMQNFMTSFVPIHTHYGSIWVMPQRWTSNDCKRDGITGPLSWPDLFVYWFSPRWPVDSGDSYFTITDLFHVLFQEIDIRSGKDPPPSISFPLQLCLS